MIVPSTAPTTITIQRYSSMSSRKETPLSAGFGVLTIATVVVAREEVPRAITLTLGGDTSVAEEIPELFNCWLRVAMLKDEAI